MNIKNDDMLVHLRTFGFHCEEKTQEGFIRYTKRIGNMLVTVANGQFENKIRISLLQDAEGKIRTTHKDIVAYTDMICALTDAGMLGSVEYIAEPIQEPLEKGYVYDMNENPLISFPMKPEGFMAQ